MTSTRLRDGWISLSLLAAAFAAGCGDGATGPTAPSEGENVGIVITHPEDFYIYFYDRDLQQIDVASLSGAPYYDLTDTWNHSNQAKGNTPFVSYQSDDGGRLHVFWEIGRKGSTQDSSTFQSKLADGGLSAVLGLGVANDQKTTSYMPEDMNFGLQGELTFGGYGSVEMLLGQSGVKPWHQIEHQIKEAIEDSVYAEAFEGVDVDEDLETFEHIGDVIEDLFGFQNVWTIGVNGFTYGSESYPAAMINWHDLSTSHCDNPSQALLAPLSNDGVPTGYQVLILPRDCDDDHEMSVVLWNFTMD